MLQICSPRGGELAAGRTSRVGMDVAGWHLLENCAECCEGWALLRTNAGMCRHNLEGTCTCMHAWGVRRPPCE